MKHDINYAILERDWPFTAPVKEYILSFQPEQLFAPLGFLFWEPEEIMITSITIANEEQLIVPVDGKLFKTELHMSELVKKLSDTTTTLDLPTVVMRPVYLGERINITLSGRFKTFALWGLLWTEQVHKTAMPSWIGRLIKKHV